MDVQIQSVHTNSIRLFRDDGIFLPLSERVRTKFFLAKATRRSPPPTKCFPVKATSSPSAPMHPDLATKFKPFDERDLSHVVARVAKEHSDWDPQRLQTAVQEYRKWLFLCAMKPADGGPLGMGATPGSRDVDEVWHAHILFTKDYHQACLALCGHFVHHTPTSDEEQAHGNRHYANTLSLYQATFGQRHPSWFIRAKEGRAGECDNACTTKCGKCNTCDDIEICKGLCS